MPAGMFQKVFRKTYTNYFISVRNQDESLLLFGSCLINSRTDQKKIIAMKLWFLEIVCNSSSPHYLQLEFHNMGIEHICHAQGVEYFPLSL